MDRIYQCANKLERRCCMDTFYAEAGLDIINDQLTLVGEWVRACLCFSE